MKLPLHIAAKLLKLEQGEQLPASRMQHPIITDMIEEGILYRPGKLRSAIRLVDKDQFSLYLFNHFSIRNLEKYVETLQTQEATRADLVITSTDSKSRYIRTFRGFLINSYQPIEAMLNGEYIRFTFVPGTFRFICDFTTFIPPDDVTIVGIENPECFRHIERYQSLFSNITPLFVSRYPQQQGKDLIKWLQAIPNNYLHFGDLDFAGINIYLSEYKVHLGNRARFYVPPQMEDLFNRLGNKERYHVQKLRKNKSGMDEAGISQLIEMIEKYQAGVDQEGIIP